MPFAEYLRKTEQATSEEDYAEAYDRIFTQIAIDRFPHMLEDEYTLFLEECLTTARTGKRQYTMEVLRDRPRMGPRINEVYANKSISPQTRDVLLMRMCARGNHFTDEEVDVLTDTLEKRLIGDGFDDAMILVAHDQKCGYRQWEYRVQLSASW